MHEQSKATTCLKWGGGGGGVALSVEGHVAVAKRAGLTVGSQPPDSLTVAASISRTTELYRIKQGMVTSGLKDTVE